MALARVAAATAASRGNDPRSPLADNGHAERTQRAPTRRRLAWAELLARVFLIDVLLCPHCGGRRRILSFITEPGTVRRIFAHLRLPSTPPPTAPATPPLAPDGEWCVDVAYAEDEPSCDGEPDADPDGDVDARSPP